MPGRPPQPCWRHRRHPSRPLPRRWGNPTKKTGCWMDFTWKNTGFWWFSDGFHLEKHWFLVIFGWISPGKALIFGDFWMISPENPWILGEFLDEFQLKREFDGMVLVEFTWNFNWSFWWFLWISAEQSSFLGRLHQNRWCFLRPSPAECGDLSCKTWDLSGKQRESNVLQKTISRISPEGTVCLWLQQHIFEILKPELWLWYQKLLHTYYYFISRELDLIAKVIELDDRKIYRKALYLMVKTMVSSRFSLKPIQWKRLDLLHICSHDFSKCCGMNGTYGADKNAVFFSLHAEANNNNNSNSNSNSNSNNNNNNFLDFTISPKKKLME